MSDPIDDGGPAFPQSIAFNQNGEAVTAGAYFDGTGMSIRDYFAGQALPELIKAGIVLDETPILNAKLAYIIADAMLEARKVKQ